ncbi:MAG: hypothetical protein ACYST6_07775 [Planctomycetota bacterium]|jgi:hypothetical protein
MAALIIPKILYKSWFWLLLAVALIAIHFFWGKAPAPAKPSSFSIIHKKKMRRMMDVYVLCFLVFWYVLLMPPAVIDIYYFLSAPGRIQAADIRLAAELSLTKMIVFSGLSGVLIGFLSVFQTTITTVKRVILLGICLLPMSLAVLQLMIEPSLGLWATIKTGLHHSFSCWMINGPAIILGKPLLEVAWRILCKLRLASGECPW